MTLVLPRGAAAVEVRLHREGFSDVRRSVAPLRDDTLDITLAATRSGFRMPQPLTTKTAPSDAGVVAAPIAPAAAPDAAVRPLHDNGRGDNLLAPHHGR
jgi:hypothetical protein